MLRTWEHHEGDDIRLHELNPQEGMWLGVLWLPFLPINPEIRQMGGNQQAAKIKIKIKSKNKNEKNGHSEPPQALCPGLILTVQLIFPLQACCMQLEETKGVFSSRPSQVLISACQPPPGPAFPVQSWCPDPIHTASPGHRLQPPLVFFL